MRKIFLTIAVALIMSISASAQTTKVVTDSVTFMPDAVKIHEGLTKNGNPKWWIELPAEDGKTRKVSLSQSHVTSDRLLALIERRDTTTGKYTYSVKFAEPKKRTSANGKADLSSLK